MRWWWSIIIEILRKWLFWWSIPSFGSSWIGSSFACWLYSLGSYLYICGGVTCMYSRPAGVHCVIIMFCRTCELLPYKILVPKAGRLILINSNCPDQKLSLSNQEIEMDWSLCMILRNFIRSHNTMLRVLICVPPILPSTPWEPGPAPGRPRLVHICPTFFEAHSSSEGGARPSEDGNEGGEKPEGYEDRQLLAKAQWELVAECLLLLVCLAHFQDIERVIAFHDVDPTVGLIVHFKEIVAFSNYCRIHLLLEGTSLETRQKCRKTKDYSIPPKLHRPFDIVTIGIRFVDMTLSFVSWRAGAATT